MPDMKYLSGVAEYRYPEAGDPPCPRGETCLILTRLGAAHKGTWAADSMAWAPLPRRDKAKEKLIEEKRRGTHR